MKERCACSSSAVTLPAKDLTEWTTGRVGTGSWLIQQRTQTEDKEIMQQHLSRLIFLSLPSVRAVTLAMKLIKEFAHNRSVCCMLACG